MVRSWKAVTGLICVAGTLACGADTQARRRTTAHRDTAKMGTATEQNGPIKNVFWQPNQLKQGSVMLITAEFDRMPARVSGSFANRKLLFFHSKDNPKVWTALAGVDLETPPGSYGLDVNASFGKGRPAKKTQQIDVAQGDFKPSAVEVPENFVNPNAEELKEIAKDEILKKRAYAHATRMPLWSGNFLKPVDAPATESFGAARMLNEEKTSTHRGTDFGAKEGSVVKASNSGTVVLAAEMFYEGNCVIIDHGLGLFTIYMHLKQMDVKAGDKVEKGDKLGISGATGRVTGPHMHFGVRWSDAYLDPLQLLALTLPKTSAEPEEKKPAVRRAVKRRAR